jgi:hypothetical protein
MCRRTHCAKVSGADPVASFRRTGSKSCIFSARWMPWALTADLNASAWTSLSKVTGNWRPSRWARTVCAKVPSLRSRLRIEAQ